MIIIPNPKKIELTTEEFIIKPSTKIVLGSTLSVYELDYALLLKKRILEITDLDLEITRTLKHYTNSIILNINKSLDDCYHLEINASNITINANSVRGLLHGVQTLRQIITQKGRYLNGCIIEDSPALRNRGFYHDITRGRVPTYEALKELIDVMSYYKLNQLQLYVEHTYLFDDFSEVTRETDTLTAEEILKLDQYAIKHGVELVPSLSTFGHLYRLLISKSYSHLCELDVDENQPFSFIDRMSHHTLDVSNEDSFKLVKKMLDEYIPLFTSNKFNICCDETFDLGKGKSKALKEEIGEGLLYLNFVNKIVGYVKSFGKEVMMWGDIITNHPDIIDKLDRDVVLLSWWYDPKIPEDKIRLVHERNLKQYVCSGTSSWNKFVNPYKYAYENIFNITKCGKENNIIGLLNTNWGDYGNINTVATTIPCLIYGAQAAWSDNIPSFEQINHDISVLEYGDKSGKFLDLVYNLTKSQLIDWTVIVGYLESKIVNKDWVKEMAKNFYNSLTLEKINNSIKEATEAYETLAIHINTLKHPSLNDYLLMGKAIILFNKVGLVIKNEFFSEKKEKLPIDYKELAAELEYWFLDFKKSWRKDSKESELFRIGEVIFAYADILRDLV